MKKTLVLLLITLTIAVAVNAQEVKSPTFIKKAKYFDKTPPLREMKVIMPGERKRAWKDGVIRNESVEMRGKAKDTEVGTYQFLQKKNGTDQSRGPIVSIKGVGNVNGVYPPDTDGDVGPNHYFQMINLSFAIWDKEGNKLYGPVDNSTLWEGFIGPWTGSNDGDPILLYDEAADRWVATQFAIERPNGKSYELVAVSATGDPLGEYYRYAFEFDYFNDYPKVGVWGDGYYATFNFFDQGFYGSGVAAFERDKMLAGEPDAQMVFFGYFEDKFSLQPSDFDGPLPPAGTPAYIATMNAFASKQFEIYAFHVDWQNPNNSTYQLDVSLDPGYFNSEIDGIPQPGGSTLDDLSQMLMYRLAYRNFGTHQTMIANHTVNVDGRAGIKWYEFRKEGATDWYIYQQGVYAPNDGLHRWMGSAAINAQGTIALGYSVAGTNHYASIRYTGRPANAPLGEMTYEEVEAVTGFGSQTVFSRWGDYANLSVDPVNDSMFWFTTEYMDFNWKTRIVAFDFSPLVPPTVYAGEDGSFCQDTFYYTNASAQYYKSLLWTTSGDGYFIYPKETFTPYLRGNQDVLNGQVTLTLTATGYIPNSVVSDDILLHITWTPVVDAGNDTIINTNSVYYTNGQASNYAGLNWSSTGDGNFADPSALETVYTPGPGDIAAGGTQLTLTAQPLDPCSFGKSDVVEVLLDPNVGISENFTKTEFRISPNPTNGAFTIHLNGIKSAFNIQIINSEGSEIFMQRIENPGEDFTRHFDLKYLPKGVYVVKITSGSEYLTKKIVLE